MIEVELMNDKEAQLANDYPKIQNDFYNGRITDETMTGYVTQPFWHSVIHSRKRMNKKGVRLETTPVKRTKKPGFIKREELSGIEVSDYHQKVVERKKVFFGNRCIYKKKDKKIYNTSILNMKRDENFCVCPNCGASAPVSSFVNGCDFCGNKFLVNASDNKISSFSSRENTGGRVLSVFLKLIISLVAVLLLAAVIVVTGFVLAIIFDSGVGWYTYPELKTMLSRYVLFCTGIIPPIFKFVILTLIVFMVIGICVVKKFKHRIQGTDIVRDLVREVVPEDFAQNLEYKLRSIHYADAPGQVAAFSTFDMTNIIENYSDVIETSMNKLSFIDTAKDSRGVYVDVEVSLNNLRLVNEKIVEDCELVKVRMLARHDMVEQKVNSIASYKCSNCGGSIDLLEGGFCSSCGKAVDYGKYNWLIDSYEIVGKAPKEFNRIRWLLVGVYTVMVLIVGGIFYLENTRNIMIYLHLDEAYAKASEAFDEIEAFDDVCDDVRLSERKDYDIIQMYTYESDYVKNDAADYISYLWTIGFDESDDSNPVGSGEYDNVVKLERPYKFESELLRGELTGQIVIIEYDDGGDEVNVIYDVE